jgi:hypothetical protein
MSTSAWVSVKAALVRAKFPKLVSRKTDARLADDFDMVHELREFSMLTIRDVVKDAAFWKNVRIAVSE